ncbi:MAG: cell division protein DivIVA [Erysipelotrichia bacterium]|nr:cell division protein DivIVA [Erysipelotrichia bacterium]
MKKGYNRYQVDSAIHNLEEEVSVLQKRLEASNSQMEADKEKIMELNLKLELLNKDVEMKEKAASQMAQIALKEASSIIQTANENADAIIKEAYYSAKDILLNISKLGVEAKGIKDTLNDQLRLLSDSIEQFDVPPIPSAELLKKCDE